MDRIFAHTRYRECAGGKWSNPRISRKTLLCLLGFAVASDLYFQPKDEVLHKQTQGAKGRFAIPTQCSHRSFITFGDAFTTCPEDPSRCFALVNRNRWHSHLCATNPEAPGEMPSVLPKAVIVRTARNLIDMLYERSKSSAKTFQRFAELCVDSAPSTSSNSTSAAISTIQSLPLVVRRQNRVLCPIAINHPSQNHLAQSGADECVFFPVGSDGDIFSAGQLETDVSLSGYQPVVLQRCVVCNIVPACEPLIDAMNIEYMISVPLDHALKEQWSTHICQHLSYSFSEEIHTAFRLQQQPRLCLRHFNPRTVVMNEAGSITRTSSAVNEPPVFNFEQFAKLNWEFSQAFKSLLDAIERNQNANTIGDILKIVQDLVKCTDFKCNRALSNHTDILLHRYHQLKHKYVCSECFNTVNILANEQDMVEHVIMEHCKERVFVSPVYCTFNILFSKCATRFFSTLKMEIHNEIHERCSSNVACCYLCGIADPWKREVEGVKFCHEVVHAVERYVVCKTCMTPVGPDHTGFVLVDHFIRAHMDDPSKRLDHCNICLKCYRKPGVAEHIQKCHKLIVFRPRFAPESNRITVMNGEEFCEYLGIPLEARNFTARSAHY
ncbi:hypothetical protein KIN20_022619 [Parelaphostrongylus tenuis]|uniref:Uncharacterized protein n=1 Tax=Parelaphostrongylus tenuis TaxID=148309 RepID=A0AAD5MQJ0_PARTN|nr:hypothetical protein KIN20_022619 [Parelaphostrongylus tenuis]